MKSIVTFCDKSIAHLKKIASPNVLIGVKGGGCNGLKYFIQPCNTPEKYDEVIDMNEFQIVVCGKSLMYLIGTHFEWKEDYMGSAMTMQNPNANSKCGCGETFNI